MTINHHPIVKRGPNAMILCGGSGYANPMEPLTCPNCRAKLAAKSVNAAQAAAVSKGQERRFFEGVARHYAEIAAA